jgi:hypothetical protein
MKIELDTCTDSEMVAVYIFDFPGGPDALLRQLRLEGARVFLSILYVQV